MTMLATFSPVSPIPRLRAMPQLSDAGDALVEADRLTAQAVLPHEKSLAVRILDPIADLGDQPQMRVLCASVIAVGLFGGERRLAGAGVRMLAAHTLATLAKDVIKRRIDRTRPRSAEKPGKDHKPRPGSAYTKEENSFPSGHSAGAAAVARAYARSYPQHAAAAYGGAAVISLGQIPRCAHYPTDVGAGLAVGIAAEAITERAIDAVLALARKKGIE
jgi:membrane-associated phospholipid phosphatase